MLIQSPRALRAALHACLAIVAPRASFGHVEKPWLTTEFITDQGRDCAIRDLHVYMVLRLHVSTHRRNALLASAPEGSSRNLRFGG